ncbi:hypothetical protein M8J76_007307 [Diaphorina citri]|nr:hypothetical protein M8J76_007307 [Diaphorina citri]
MKTYTMFLLCIIASSVSTQSQEATKQAKLLKKPRVYNAIVKSDEELIPSQSYPAVAPVIRPVYTGIFPYAPLIVPQVQPYGAEGYGNVKISPDDGEGKDLLPRELVPPSPNQPKSTYKDPASTEVDQVPFNLEGEIPQTKGSTNQSFSSKGTENYDNSQGSEPMNYEGDLSPTSMDDSYFQDVDSKIQHQSNDYGRFLQPPSEIFNDKKNTRSKVPSGNVPENINPLSFFNYQPENFDIPNVRPPPIPVTQNSNNSTKKTIDYPNAPPTLFSL